MKERCGLGFAGVLLLMLTGGSSDAHNVQRSSEDVHNSYSSSETFDLRETRDAASDLGPLSGLGARGGGAPHVWSERGPGPGGWSANSQGDISKHMVIDVSSADTSVDNQVKPSPARPPNPPVETVLGFETSGEQVPGKVGGPRNDAQVPSGQTSFGSGQQLDNGSKQTGQPGQVGREDISIEVDTDPGSALPSSHGQSAFQTRPDQPRARAVARQSGRLLGDPAKSPRQLSRPMMARQGAGAGDARPRDSISLTAEVADGPDRGGQAAGAATAPGGPVSSEQLQQRAHSQQWLPEAIPGQAGVDYPTLNVLPQSSFDCGVQEADGFYADTSDEARCQAFWVCHNDQKDGFLCPNGTVFNQRYFACDWWFNVRCQDSPQYYQLNRNIAVLGTPVHGRPDTPPSPETSVHPVLTLLQDILQYPRVPPIPPPSSPAASEENPPIHSAAQPALPSRNQYSDDEFHAPDRASVHVAGGVPGTPPAEGRAGNLMSKGASQETISSTMRLSENKRGIARRHVKRHVKRTPEKQHRAIMKRRRPTRVRARKVRGYDMVHEAEEAERAASALSARIPQMEQSAMSQLKKRTPEPSSGAAFTSVQEGAMPDKPQSLLSGRSGPLLQTVDKVAFPMDAKGPDFPKVEEDFNIQETSGIRKSTSIKSVLPSHLDIPQPGAVNVMAASGSQQNADVNSQSGVRNQASITDLSDGDTGVSKNFAGISLTEDVQLDKDAHAQVPGVISDAETVSGSYGPGHGVSLVEDVEFDKKKSVPAPASPAAPQSKPGPNGMSVLESVAGDNGHGPGVSVQENVQVDQKRDVSAAVGPPDASSPGMPAPQQTPGNPAAGPAAGGGPGMTMTEDVAVSRPTSNENTAAGVGDPMSGDNMRSPGVSLTENVQIGHKGNSPPNGPSSNAQPVSGNPAGGQAMTGGAGSVGGAEPANGGRPPNVDQMAVDGFLSDQTAVRTPPPAPPPGPGIRSEESVQVDFDEKSQNKQQEDMSAQISQIPSNQPPGQAPKSPNEAAAAGESSEQQPAVGSNAGRDSASEPRRQGDNEDGIKVSPKAEQVLEEQSNVKILIPYDGQEEAGYVPSGSITAADDHMGNLGIGNQVNTGIALGNAGAHNTPQDQQAGQQIQDKPPQSQSQSQSQNPTQNSPQSPSQSSQYQTQGRPQDLSAASAGQISNQPRSQLQSQQRGQRMQSDITDSFSGGLTSGPTSVSSGPAQPGKGKENVKIAEDVSVRRDPAGGLGSGVPSAGVPRPGYQHAGDAHMNASAMTIPKKEGSSKILEELDARSQFASNVGDEPGTVKTHVQMMEEKLGDQPGISDLLDDPSALKREMPSENVKALQQQQTPPPPPQGEIIPGRQNVQITSESVSRIIKNPSRHRSAIKDPSGLDLPELLRPPGFGTNYSPFKAYPTMRTVKPASPATPQPSVARLAGSIDMKSGNNAAGAPSNPRTLTAGISEKQVVPSNGGISGASPAASLQRPERGDLSTKLSDTLKMVDNILGPPPFKSKRNLQPKLQRAAYLDSMETGHPSAVTGRGQKRASDGDLQDGNMGINLTVLINEQPEDPAGQTGASVAASAGPQTVKEKDKIEIFDSLKGMASKKAKGEKRKKHKLKQTAEETEIKDIIEVKTPGDDDDSDKTYDYDISDLPSWMKKAVRKHVKSPHAYR